MSSFKCCVSGCNATSATHKLFTFPKNDYLRKMWMSFLGPTNSLLINLSKDQLLRKRVCEKHFDKHQFDEEGKRLRFSYPCLFTDKEITHGEPLLSVGIGSMSDHNYSKVQSDEDGEIYDSLLTIRKADENFHEHPTYSYSQSLSSVTECQRDAVSEQLLCSSNLEIDLPSTSEHTDENFHEHPTYSYSQSISSVTECQRDAVSEQLLCSSNLEIDLPSTSEHTDENFHEHPTYSYSQSLSSVTECQRDAVSEQLLCSSNLEIDLPSTSEHTANESNPLPKVKTVQVLVSSKKYKIVKQMTRIASDSLGLTAPQRIKEAIAYSNNEKLLKNFEFLSKQAQTFLLMQLRLCRQKRMSRRFTMEEKLLCLILLKESPKSYKLLEKMFALPNKRTLYTLSEKIGENQD